MTIHRDGSVSLVNKLQPILPPTSVAPPVAPPVAKTPVVLLPVAPPVAGLLHQ
jgi:hypothetical protein